LSKNGQFYLDFEKPLMEMEARIAELKKFTEEKEMDFSEEIMKLEGRAAKLAEDIFGNLTRWQRVQLARHPKRPFTLDYTKLIFQDFLELHGDRAFRDDPAMVGGIANLEGRPVTIIGHQKGRDTKENIARNFGMPHPEGYRKALRLMKQADKFKRPIICLVDTPAAYPGVGAEERGQALAIAESLRDMAKLRVPVVVVITGEGGSGGALGIAVGNTILMMENAIYSVCPPESCAAIIWKDSKLAEEAAEELKLTATDLLDVGIVDEVIREPLGGAHKNYEESAARIKEAIIRHLSILDTLTEEELIEERYEKFRSMGEFFEGGESR
jgi:acetyl-CoA carboxylase carboxyl transferase subunit alpha